MTRRDLFDVSCALVGATAVLTCFWLGTCASDVHIPLANAASASSTLLEPGIVPEPPDVDPALLPRPDFVLPVSAAVVLPGYARLAASPSTVNR